MKTALVLEGGASRALFGVGVTDVLLQNGIYADVVVGSSAGIANGVSYVSKQYGRAKEVAVRYTSDKRYMGLPHLLDRSNRSLYNIPFVFEDIPNQLIPYDYDTLAATDCKAYACVTNIATGKAEYLPITVDRSWKALVATCALPLLFQPVEYGGKLYMDGGIAQSVPVDFALEQGCDRVLCVLTRERNYRKKDREAMLTASALLYRKYPAFAELLKQRNILYNQAREHLFDLERKGKVMLITPEDTHGFSRTEKDPERLQQIWAQGERIAKAQLDQIQTYLNQGAF